MLILTGEFGGPGVEKPGHGLVQPILLSDLAHRAADAIDIGGRWLLVVAAHPIQEIYLCIESFAAGEDLPKPCAGMVTEVPQERFRGTVDIAEKYQADGEGARRQADDGQILRRLIVENHKAREMQAIECAKGDQRIARVGKAVRLVHRGEQAAQPG